MKRIFSYLMVVICSGVAALLILSLAFLLPTSQEHYEQSKTIIENEGWYPRVPIQSSGEYFGQNYAGILDNSSDMIMISTAMYENNEHPVQAALEMNSEYTGAYTYYWHGYVFLLRVLLLLFNYEEIRVLNAVVQGLLMLYVLNLIRDRLGKKYMLVFTLSYFLLMPLALVVSLQYSWVFYITYGLIAALLKKEQFIKNKNGICYVFLVGGILTSLFDLLTYPLLTWGLPVLCWICLSETDEEKKNSFFDVIRTGIAWIAGYAGMWLMKWTLASLILHTNIFETAWDEVLFRSGVQDQNMWTYRLGAILINWKHYEDKIFMGALVILTVIVTYRAIRRKLQWDPRCKAVLLVACAPFVWYIVLCNHTNIHNMFTYRIFDIGVTALLLYMVMRISEEKEQSLRVQLKKGAICLIFLIVGLLMPLNSTGESLKMISGEMEETILAPQESMQGTFTPEGGKILRINLLDITTDSENAVLEMELYNEAGEIVKTKKIAMDAAKDNYSIDCDWRLEQKPYILKLTYLAGDGECRIKTVSEGGLPLSGIYYETKRIEKGRDFLFLWLSGYFVAVFLSGILKTGTFVLQKSRIKVKI